MSKSKDKRERKEKKFQYADGCIDCVGSVFAHRCENCGRNVTTKEIKENDKKWKTLMSKSPKVSEEKEITVGETLRWLDKLEKVTSKGAKIAMVSMLLRRNQSDTLKRVREGLPKKEPIKVTKKNIGKPDLVFQYCRGYNAAIDEVLSLISGMKKEL